MDDQITIYHNPRCSNSRAALALLQERGLVPRIVDYLKTPLDRAALQALVAATGVPLRELLRSKEAAYAALGLGDAACTEAQLLDAVVQYPELLNRPIVVAPRGALLCRPPERVLELLPPL
ncbi:arsenate reductase (glutaredoxin) [Acidovorax sp. SRB_24]|uniref:arsenate reductase (glutaredoxin) n=1 Tax=Acidovorax sp. SRB_24 TaxID=1962700 RepID=UPI00145CAA06|nr:arsenate reductase (glutaredoxin) [Acidovorax sp. SRB_24]NMM76636.1 arsenate reductase (glutaredoxin) [Acidovorax sp. SRB_24]